MTTSDTESTWAADEDDETDSLLRAIASAPPLPIAPIAPGTIVAGKYRIESQIGRGGMGMVWRARDERLDRPLAIKFQLGARGEVERLRREARALASLSHPNVVTVLEVGTHEGAMYIAMELVDGANARQWVGERPRHWREIVAMYRQAGAGLVAAHGVGIVHRDFKPDNVLVGREGRVRVADFGLARSGIDAEHPPLPPFVPAHAIAPQPSSSGAASPDLPEHRTRTDAIVGTPAYMAPEQLATSRVDVRADQFAFCVALYEALYGERPFASLAALAADRAPRRPADPGRAPAWVLRVLQRGLARDPGDRWPSLQDLLARLDPRRRRRAWIPLAIAGATAGVVAVAWPAGPVVEGCEAAGSIDDVWNADRASAIDRALRSTGVAGVERAWDRVGPRLGAHASAWSDAWREACATADDRTLDRELACLRSRRSELAVIVDVLASADAATAARAGGLDAALREPHECLGAPLETAPGVAIAADVAALREVLAKAHVHGEAGHTAFAAALLDPVVARAHAIGYRPLVAESLYERAVARGRERRDADSYADLQDALAIAVAERLDRTALDAAALIPAALGHLGRQREALDACASGDALASRWPALVGSRVRLELACGTVHVNQHDLDAAERRMQAAFELAQGVDDGGELRASALEGRARVEARRGRFDHAVALQQESLATIERSLGPEHPRVAVTLESLGYYLTGAERRVDARLALERALRIHEQSSGVEHPAVLETLLPLAQLDSIEGDDAGALARLERARRIAVDHGTDEEQIIDIEGAIGYALAGLGRPAEALEVHRRQLERIEDHSGADHPHLRYTLNNMAMAGRDCGRSNDAELWLRRAIAIDEAQLERDPFSSTLHFDLGFLLLDRGELAAAESEFRVAAEIGDRMLAPDDPDRAWVLFGLGRVAAARGRPADAVPLLAEAFARWDVGTYAGDRAVLRRELVEALWAEGRDRPRAVALAREGLAEDPQDEELRAFLRRHAR